MSVTERSVYNKICVQEQDDIARAAEAQHCERGAQRRSGRTVPGPVQARDGAAAAGEDEPRRGAAPNTRRHQRCEYTIRIHVAHM